MGGVETGKSAFGPWVCGHTPTQAQIKSSNSIHIKMPGLVAGLGSSCPPSFPPLLPPLTSVTGPWHMMILSFSKRE